MTDFQAPNNSYEMMLAMLGGINPKSVNTMQDLSSYLFNPQYGITGDTYESAYTLPEPYVPNTPRLDAYMNSANPIWRDVASGIQSGSLDEASAVAALYNSLGFEYDTEIKQGLSVSDLRSAVKEMFDEKERDMAARIEYDRNLLESERENVFGKAGLPQPYDQWSAETMPVSDELKAFLSRLPKIQSEISDSRKRVLAAEKLAKSRMLDKTTPSKGTTVDSDLVDQYQHWINLDKKLKENPTMFPTDVVQIVKRKMDEYQSKLDSPETYEDRLKKQYSKWFDLQARIDANPKMFSTDVVQMAKNNLDEYQKKLNESKTQKVSDSDMNEQKLFLNRAVNQTAQDERQNVVNLQRKLLQNQAVAANRLLGEKIALGIQGRNPLEEALRRRALGLQGM